MPSTSDTPVSPERLMGFTFGFAPPLMIEAAIRHRVFDALEKGAKTINALCVETGTSPRGLRIVLNALVGLDLLSKDEVGRYALTKESATFLISGKSSFHGAFFLLTSEPMLSSWGKLHEIMRTGRPSHCINREGDGVAFFQQFVEDIFPIHYAGAQALAKALDVSKAESPVSVLDLAAGSGVWSIPMAQHSPQVRVTAVDWPGIIAITQKVTARHGVADRYAFVAGDLHKADFGQGHAIATLGHILHSEGEERSRQLLRKTFDALTPGGTIAIAEILVDAERRSAVPALIFAVNMLVNSDQGDTFTFDEIRSWLHDAGFERVRTVEAPGLAPLLILATKPCVRPCLLLGAKRTLDGEASMSVHGP
jgi:2-polyprenyl-3-methyl-5-hydroxy-6-metoxy-1,4-benzoquinol methylase